MPLITLKKAERDKLIEIVFRLKNLSERYPAARQEVMTAIRCLKAVHSNAIEDRSIDRVFLQILLHKSGIADKGLISQRYQKAALEIQGHDGMFSWMENEAAKKEPFSISMLLHMHRMIFEKSWPDIAGRFRDEDVKIARMNHEPPHSSKIQLLLQQHFMAFNESLPALEPVSPKNFFEILRLSAQVHYLIAHVHPFRDGNGRIARTLGDYVLLRNGLFYDVIMTDYRDRYLDALEESELSDCTALFEFLQYSYLETLERISTFFKLLDER